MIPYPAVNFKVGIFWDIENYPPPSGMAGYTVSHKFRAIASQFGSISVFKAYMDLHLPMNANSATVSSLCSELQNSGVSVTNCPHTPPREKEHADKMLLVDMLGFAIENPSPAVLLIITGDRDFSYGISVLRQHQYRVILVTPKGHVHPALTAQADVVVTWDQLFGPDAATGGGHLIPGLTDLRGALSNPQQAVTYALADAPTSLAIDAHPSSLRQPEPEAVARLLVPQSVSQPTGWIAEINGGSAPDTPDTPVSESTGLTTPDEHPRQAIKPAFLNLVDILVEIAPTEPAGERWRTIKDLLLAREPDLLEKHNLSRPTDFLNWAEQEDVIIVQREKPRRIALHPRLREATITTMGSQPEAKDKKKLAECESAPNTSIPPPSSLFVATSTIPMVSAGTFVPRVHGIDRLPAKPMEAAIKTDSRSFFKPSQPGLTSTAPTGPNPASSNSPRFDPPQSSLPVRVPRPTVELEEGLARVIQESSRNSSAMNSLITTALTAGSTGTPLEPKDEKKLVEHESAPHPSLRPPEPLSPDTPVTPAPASAPIPQAHDRGEVPAGPMESSYESDSRSVLKPSLPQLTSTRASDPHPTCSRELRLQSPRPASPTRVPGRTFKLEIGAAQAAQGSSQISPLINSSAAVASTASSKSNKASISMKSAVISPTQPPIPQRFLVLVSALKEMPLPARSSMVASQIIKRNPNAWAGRFKKYIQDAKEAGVITITSGPGKNPESFVNLCERFT